MWCLLMRADDLWCLKKYTYKNIWYNSQTYFKLGVHLKDTNNEDSRISVVQWGRIPRDHVEEPWHEVGAGVQLDISRQQEVGERGVPGDVAGHVDRVQHVVRLHVGGRVCARLVGRFKRAVELVPEEHLWVGDLERRRE